MRPEAGSHILPERTSETEREVGTNTGLEQGDPAARQKKLGRTSQKRVACE